jgi:hypothetical protein
VADRLDVGVALGAGRAERVAVERPLAGDDLDPRLGGDGLGGLRRQRLLREHGLDLGGPDPGDQVADVAAGQLGGGVERGDDRADQLQAVPVDVVAEGVVVGDQLLVGEAVDLAGDLGVQVPQLAVVGGQVGPEPRGGVRRRLGEGALDVGGHALGVAGVLPDVGVGPALALAQRHPLAGVDHRAAEPGALDGVVEPVLEADAVSEHHVGAGDRVQVGRGRLVVVGVHVGLDQAGDPHPVAADDAGEVGDLRGGGDHLQRPPPRGAARPGGPAVGAAGGEDRQQPDGEDDPASAHDHSHRVTVTGGHHSPSGNDSHN